MIVITMSRLAQIDVPDALHHAMACGERREAVFRDDRDRFKFLGYLVEGESAVE